MIYNVSVGETLRDVAINATGIYNNVQAIANNNGFTDWDTELFPGQQIVVDDALPKDAAALETLTAYPVASGVTGDQYKAVDNLMSFYSNQWILSDGTWNGTRVWTKTGLWLSAIS